VGKTVKKIAKIAAIAGLIFFSFGAATLLAAGTTFLSAVATVYTAFPFLAAGVAVAASIGFAASPKPAELEASRELASNLSINTQADAVRAVIFGRSAVAGQVLFRENITGSGGNPDELLLILGLAGYPVTSMEKFWLNDELVWNTETTTGPGAIVSGTFAGDLWLYFRTGEEVTAAFPAIAALSATWNAATRKLLGIPCVAIRLKVTDKLKGRIEPLTQVKGAKLYDPRLDNSVPGGSGTHLFATPSTWTFSTNGVLPSLLYLMGGTVNSVRVFGMGKPRTAIDLENFASEANICDEAVPVLAGGTIARYSCNGRLVPDADHRVNLEKLLSPVGGSMDASTGIYRIFVAAWRASVMTLTEADVDGAPDSIELLQDPSNEINIIRGVFADTNDKWNVKEYPERRDAASIAIVGENSLTMDLPFTNDHRIAQRLAKIRMYRANAQRKMEAKYWLRAIVLQPGDIVTQTYARYGLNAQTMRVNVWGLGTETDAQGNPKMAIPMQLVQEDQSWFNWTAASEEAALTGVVALPSLNTAPTLTTLGGTNVLIYEGTAPPFNPQTGWLWRDTDLGAGDQVFRWSGVAWVAYSTRGAPAGYTNQYGDGTGIDLLRPSEIGANGSPYGWTPVYSAGMSRLGNFNTFYKSSGISAWDSGIRSVEGYMRAGVSFIIDTLGVNYMIGLNTDPTLDHSYTSLDHALYVDGIGGNVLRIYESGTDVTGPFLAATTGMRLSILRDRDTVRYYVDGVLYREVAVTPAYVWMDSSFYQVGAQAQYVEFWQLDSVSTNQIDLAAATEVLSNFVDGPVTAGPASNSEVEATTTIVSTVVDEATDTFEIVATGRSYITASGTTTGAMGGSHSLQYQLNGGGWIIIDSVVKANVAGAATAAFNDATYSMTGSITGLTPGAAIDIRLSGVAFEFPGDCNVNHYLSYNALLVTRVKR
jgi:hypothetical protein